MAATPPPRTARLAAALALALVLLPPPGLPRAARAAARPAPPADVRQADALAAAPGGVARDKLLRTWAKDAPLADLLFVLRRPPEQLGAAEGGLLRAALGRVPAPRQALRERLEARLARVAPSRAPRDLAARLALRPVLDPRASVFRLGLLLPDSGDYAAYGVAVRAGVEAALADANSVSLRPVETWNWPTGDDEPARAARAADSAAAAAGAVIGPLLSVPSFAAAGALAARGTPLLSPTATDETLGLAGNAVFQVGPSGARRGVALAGAALAAGRRVAMLTDGDYESAALARGFVASAAAAGADIVWRGTYAAGHPDFRAIARDIKASQADVLFWDGEPRDGAQALRALSREGARLQVCGGEALAPERHHADARPLLEGALWVDEDWSLPRGIQGRLDSLATALGEERAGSLYVRGYLSGRFVCAAVLAGALDPAEIAGFLAARRDSLPGPQRAGFLDCAREGARLRVHAVQKGRSEPLD